MKHLIIVAALLIADSSLAQQQPPPIPDQQALQDTIGVLQREVEGERNRARQAELSLVKVQRDLADMQKKLTVCKPERKE